MLFLNKNSNKTTAYKKEYFIQKMEITPKRLQIGIHNVNKSNLKILFYIYIWDQQWLLSFKKMKFSTIFDYQF
jgi:hypothetical protein